MRKKIIVCFFLCCSILSFSARPKSYQVSQKELIHWSYEAAENVFPDSIEGWKHVLVGTLAVETNLGQFKGNSIYGVSQMRNSGFQFVQRELQRNSKERKVFEELAGRSPNTVTLKMLETDHRLSIIYMAFYYKFCAHGKAHPTDKEAAAKIWKQYYNTKFGTGTPQRFLSAYAKQKKYIEQYQKNLENIPEEIKNTVQEIELLESLEIEENMENNEERKE